MSEYLGYEIVNDSGVETLVVDDGAERVPIKNKFGEEIGVFYFQPTDIGIIKRFNEVADRFQDVVAPLENANINSDGTGVESNDVAALEEAEKRLYDMCNYLFGGNLAEAFFGKMNPFSPVGGNFYCENALNAVSQYISNRMDAEAKKINARVERYTHGLRTGAHKNGRK